MQNSNVSTDTEDAISTWAGNRYGASSYPNPATSSGGMLSGAAPAPGTPAPSTTPASSGSTWSSAVAPAAAASSTPPASTSGNSTWANATTPAAPKTASGTTGGQVAPASSTPATGSTSNANANVNVASWYLNELGRMPSSNEVSYWQNRLNSGDDPQSLYSEFTSDARTNGENVTPTSWADVNTYTPGRAATPAATPTATAATLNPASLAVRTVNPATETVAGQINGLLAADSPVLQQARAQAMRSATDRGLLNSSMAASAGDDAVIGQAANIGQADAATYNNADNYNVAAENQALMTNVQNQQATNTLNAQLQDSAASRANQMSLAQLQQATSEYTANLSANTSRYSTDVGYQQQMNAQKETLVNAIINNMDLSPDRKAALLQQLGEGTSADNGTPSGLAGAVYVIGSTSADLNGGGTTGMSAAN